jgi:hypoxanthine-guanine phosphoribosyltransferase
VDELAAEISCDYEGTRPVRVCVLKGAIFFVADLARRLCFDLELEFITDKGTRLGGVAEDGGHGEWE